MYVLGIIPCYGEMFLSQDLFILLEQPAVRQGNQEETAVEDVDTCSNASPLESQQRHRTCPQLGGED